MIGEELCRDEAFVKSSASFVESIFTNALIIVKLPLGPFRGLLSWPISYFHERKLNHSARLLTPLVEKRMRGEGKQAREGEVADALAWTLEFPEQDPARNEPDYVAKELLHGLWAGSSAPGGMACEMLYQLLMEPKYLEPLREEAQKAISLNGGWTEKALNSLPLLDSFTREVNRMYPTGAGKLVASL